MLPGDNAQILFKDISRLANTSVTTMEQLTNVLYEIKDKGQNAPQNSKEYKLLQDIYVQLLKWINISRGANPTAIPTPVIRKLLDDMFSGVLAKTSMFVKAVSENQAKTASASSKDALKFMQQMEKLTGVPISRIEKNNEKHYAYLIKLENTRLAEQRESFKNLNFWAKAIYQDNSKANRSAMFEHIKSQLIARDPKYAGVQGAARAERVASRYMGMQGYVTSDLTDPDGPGGSASKRAQQAKFISGLVTALVNSPLGQKVQTVASDLVTLGLFSMANVAPGWIQKGLLGAIALGLPQTLTQVLTQMLLVSEGRQMLMQGGKMLLGRAGATAGMNAGQMLSMARAGTMSVGTMATGATAGVAGFALGSILLGGLDKIIDKATGKNNYGNLIKALGGVILAVVMGALIAAGTVTGIIPVCLAIGAAIAGIWHALTSLWKWWKGREESKDGEDQEKKHWWERDDEDSSGSGGGGGTPAPGSTIAGVNGGVFIDTSKFSKNELEKVLAKNSAYENISEGGSGWGVQHGSFINDVEFAATGTSAILNQVVAKNPKMFNGKLWVTSAYGSATSPHDKSLGAGDSHYKGGGKLDFSLSHLKTDAERRAFQKALMDTGFFDFARIEKDNYSGYHIDAKIKESLLGGADKNQEYKTPITANPNKDQDTNKYQSSWSDNPNLKKSELKEETYMTPINSSSNDLTAYSGTGMFCLDTRGGGSSMGVLGHAMQ